MIIIIFDQYKSFEVYDNQYRIDLIIIFFPGIISPVSDSYGKAGLVKTDYRIEMLQAAISNDKWLRLDTWESEQISWTRTKLVLDYHQKKIKEEFGEDVKVRLLSGKRNSNYYSLQLRFCFHRC